MITWMQEKIIFLYFQLVIFIAAETARESAFALESLRAEHQVLKDALKSKAIEEEASSVRILSLERENETLKEGHEKNARSFEVQMQLLKDEMSKEKIEVLYFLMFVFAMRTEFESFNESGRGCSQRKRKGSLR